MSNIAQVFEIGEEALQNRTIHNLDRFGAQSLAEVSENYWAYRGKLKKFNAALQDIPHPMDFKFPSLFGIEVETENVLVKRADDTTPHGWTSKGDGSLRNGTEFISYPADAQETRYLLASLYLFFVEQLKQKPDFSWRTSEHVHLNIRAMTPPVLNSFLLLYCVFESLFFRFAGLDRKESIFCVPVTESCCQKSIRYLTTVKNHRDAFTYIWESWNKYSALNLSRMRDLGTAEFRHLGGTWDLQKIGNWLNLIGALYDAANRLPSDFVITQIKSLNSLSNYGQFKNEVFGNVLSDLLGEPDNFVELLSKGVSFAKQCLINPKALVNLVEPKSPAMQVMETIIAKAKKLPPEPKKKSIRTSILGTQLHASINWGQIQMQAHQQAGVAHVNDTAAVSDGLFYQINPNAVQSQNHN